MTTQSDDALDVARFCFPGQDWEPTKIIGRVRSGFDRFDAEDREAIAAAERVLVERGLGVEYRDAMVNLYHREVMNTDWRYDYDVWALVAPLDARLRALARVVREKQPKEKA